MGARGGHTRYLFDRQTELCSVNVTVDSNKNKSLDPLRAYF